MASDHLRPHETLSPVVYVVDTTAVIDGCHDSRCREILIALVKCGRAKAPPSVFDELEIGGDDVFRCALGHRYLAERELGPDGIGRLNYLVEHYAEPFPDLETPGLWYPGLSKIETALNADFDVVALAIELGATVIAEERGIRGCCRQEKIPCERIPSLTSRETAMIPRQLGMPE